MSTKKLQIVTPIVTSVNGETGDVELNSLKNPNALTFTGGVTGTYDGSSAKTVAIPVVDSALSTTSTNAIQNKTVKTALDNKAGKDVASTTVSGLMSPTDKKKLDGIADGANKTTVDSSLRATSTNPVQNKVIKIALDGKANSTHTHDEYLSHPIQLQETTDYGTTLPSNPTNGRLFFQETSVTSLIDLVYPVGAVYISMNQTSPQTLFGGTWTQIQGRFLIGAGTVYPAGSTGGEATHTLTKDEIPDHTHTFKYTGQSVTIGVNSISLREAASNQYNAYSGGQSSNCGGGAHNNMPPYMAVYMWYRTK